MTWNERENIRNRLRGNLADYMIKHGDVTSGREQSNYYCCIRMVELTWRGISFLIIEVDGLICRIEKQ